MPFVCVFCVRLGRGQCRPWCLPCRHWHPVPASLLLGSEYRWPVEVSKKTELRAGPAATGPAATVGHFTAASTLPTSHMLPPSSSSRKVFHPSNIDGPQRTLTSPVIARLRALLPCVVPPPYRPATNRTQSSLCIARMGQTRASPCGRNKGFTMTRETQDEADKNAHHDQVCRKERARQKWT